MGSMHYKKSGILGIVAIAVMAGSMNVANAAVSPFAVSFTTVADVVLSEVTPLNFGTNVFIANGGICDMGVVPAPASLVTVPAQTGAAGTSGNITGAGCLTVNAGANGNTLGYYTVVGLGGQSVTVTVASASNADFDFAPAGCVANFDGGAGGDTCDTFTADNPIVARLSDAGDDGTVLLNSTTIVVGGRITVGATDLTPATAYTQNFNITAVYQSGIVKLLKYRGNNKSYK